MSAEGDRLSDQPTLFYELVHPIIKKLRGLQFQFDRLHLGDVEQHAEMLKDIALTEHSVWVAIALATVDLNPELKDKVERNKPCSLSTAAKSWITYCLDNNLIPLIDDETMSPIRFLPR